MHPQGNNECDKTHRFPPEYLPGHFGISTDPSGSGVRRFRRGCRLAGSRRHLSGSAFWDCRFPENSVKWCISSVSHINQNFVIFLVWTFYPFLMSNYFPLMTTNQSKYQSLFWTQYYLIFLRVAFFKKNFVFLMQKLSTKCVLLSSR